MAVPICVRAPCSALLPFLVLERHYSRRRRRVCPHRQPGDGVVQPLVGAQGDRGEARWLLPAGLVVAGLGIAAVGLDDELPAHLVAALVCSAGAATYHPEGARWARLACGRPRVTADMGVFSVGGGVGYALGPLWWPPRLRPSGLHGTLVIALVPLIAAVIVAIVLGRFRRQAGRSQIQLPLSTAARSGVRSPASLALYCVANGVTTGLLVYLPLFLVHAREHQCRDRQCHDERALGAAAAGTLLGGLTAQRLGRRFVLLVPQLVLVPAIAVLPSLGYVAMIPVVVACRASP